LPFLKISYIIYLNIININLAIFKFSFLINIIINKNKKIILFISFKEVFIYILKDTFLKIF
jgi:hypothetical protein